MDKKKIHYMLHSGKNSNLKYYIRSYLREYTPKIFSQMQLNRILRQLDQRQDKEEIMRRVNYYCKLDKGSNFNRQMWSDKAIMLQDQPVTGQKTYYFDAMEYARYFSQDLRWILDAGDKPYVAPEPAIVKNRPIVEHNENSVILNLDKNRHFLFVRDNKPWRDKKNMTIFRGDLGPRKENRDVFMNRWYGHPMVDAASTNRSEQHPEWQREKLTIGDHLDFKFIMSLEGNDVASNLKWIMSSNSIAVTPCLTQETWFMEGTLIPNYHYIEVKPDFSDLEERLTYYIEHPDEAEAIIRHAHEYVEQFFDHEREKLISLLVLKKYFEVTNGHYQ
jgi:hypothetical protein